MSTHHAHQATDTPLDERVVSVLAAAAAPTEPGPLPGEAAAVAAFRASRTAPRRSPMLASLLTVKTTAAAALSAGILITGSIGAATAGVLPAGAQDSASDLLSRVGLHVPTAKERAGEHADERAESHEQGPASTRPENGANAHGKAVSGVAHMDDLSGATNGRGKGEAVSEVASSKNQADEHRRDSSASGDHAGQSGAPEHQPSRRAGSHGDSSRAKADENRADAATKADAGKTESDAAATDGTTNATESSGGHGTGGSAQRP